MAVKSVDLSTQTVTATLGGQAKPYVLCAQGFVKRRNSHDFSTSLVCI